HSNTGHEPEITSSTSGTFSVNGQQFGFTEKGITFAGQGNPEDALKQADEALKAAGLQIEVAPVSKSFDEVSGRTSYTIGGLKISSIQKDAQVVYILCRASITSVNESSGAVPELDTVIGEQPTATSGPTGGAVDSSSRAGVAPSAGTDVGAVPVGSGSNSASFSSPSLSNSSLGSTSSSSPFTSDSTSGSAATGSVPEPAPAPQQAVPLQAAGPKTLGGFRPAAGHGTGGGTSWLYLLIALGGVVVFGGQTVLSRFAVTRG
ncbi:MAG TPA: hypothetical protein VKY26_00595, partial [Actinomycetota bacterium]|nr:hypothetical protein [Actinomycetota bacterium]